MKKLQYHGYAITPDVLITIARQKGASFTDDELKVLFKDALEEVIVGKISDERAVEVMVKFITEAAESEKRAIEEANSGPKLTKEEEATLAAASQVTNSIVKSFAKKTTHKRKTRHA